MRPSLYRALSISRVFPSTLNRISRIDVTRRCLAATTDPRETGFKIPIIDFGAFLQGSESAKINCAKEVLEGFTSSGFVYLGNTGLVSGVVSNVFSWSKRFFDLSMEEKLKLAWETPESNRGYVAPGREKVSRLLDQDEIERIRASNPDRKESLEIGKEPSDNYQVTAVLAILILL
jgi:isopenicillin N synthase-like dioxygenase